MFSTINEAELVVVGYGEMADLVSSYSLKHSNIHYYGAVKHSELIDTISSADVGLCLIENTSMNEYYSLPNKIFEYLNAGLYVICSNFPDMKKIIFDNNAGRCIDVDASMLFNEVNSLRTQDIEVSYDRKKFQWLAQENLLIAEYCKVLKISNAN